MPPFPRFILLTLMGIHLFSAKANNAQSQVSTPIVVLEATNIMRGLGGEMRHLEVRLTDDGKVEWDDYVGNAWERQTGSVTAERVSGIQRTLDSIDKSPVHGTMGPYYVYIDTSVTLQIRMTARQQKVTFSVVNPWQSGMPGPEPMPKDVKVVVCETDRLHAQVASVPVSKMCKAGNSSH